MILSVLIVTASLLHVGHSAWWPSQSRWSSPTQDPKKKSIAMTAYNESYSDDQGSRTNLLHGYVVIALNYLMRVTANNHV
jgi:hypothetical protein